MTDPTAHPPTSTPKAWPHAEITSALLAAAREVHGQFARLAYSEENYREAIANILRRRGFQAATLVDCPRLDQYGQVVGHSQADLVVNDRVVVVVKVVARLKLMKTGTKLDVPHEFTQKLQTYMHDGHWTVGMVLVFSPKQFVSRRLDQPAAPAGVRKA